MSDGPTSYDAVAYPAMVFGYSHPEALAVIARLHGIQAPPTDRARTLHIGGSDGLDAIAIAAAYPHADVLNFDISHEAIARGRLWSERAGIANARHELIDILDADTALEGPFDYIVAHGIYAWVPDDVRAAVMPMIARLLSPNGVAMVSYNAAPGGHSRRALHDMLMHHVRDLTDPAERLAAARAMLRDFAKPKDNDQPITTAMRKDAQAALAQSDGVFFHDVFNAFYAPHALLDVTADAAHHGLRYLGEARGGIAEKGFPDRDQAGLDDGALLNLLQAQDYWTGRYFRASLFVHEGTSFSRTIDPEQLRTMWVSALATSLGGNDFAVGTKKAQIVDPRRADMLRRLIAHKPAAMPVAELAQDADLLIALARYGMEGLVRLRTGAPPYVAKAGDRPVASPLARMQAADGEKKVVALNHERGTIESESLLSLLKLLDSTRDRKSLAQAWHTMPDSRAMTLDQALQVLADNALLSA